MSKVVLQLTTDTYYNVDLQEIKTLLPSPLTRTAVGYSALLDYFSVFIGDHGGIKIGIEFDDPIELQKKVATSINQLIPLINFFEKRYNIKPLNKFLLSWSDDYDPSERDWSFEDSTYSEILLESDYGKKYSQLVRI